MIQHYVVGIGALLLVFVAWVGVQRAWRKSVPDVEGDPDALAGRTGCYGCRGAAECERRRKRGDCRAEEETS